MRLYPAYKLSDVLIEPLNRFQALLVHGRRLQAEEYLILSQIAVLPYLKDKSDVDRFIDKLQEAAKDPADTIREMNDYSGIETLRNMFNGS